jgi:peptidoglycan hydrolase-like protein with peptidoglycan-binding domain
MLRRVFRDRRPVLVAPALLLVSAAIASGIVRSDEKAGADRVHAAAAVSPSTDPTVPSTAPVETTTSQSSPPATEPAPAPTPAEAAPAAPPADPARTEAATPAPAPAPVRAPPPPLASPRIPVGKGMWLYQLSMANGGNAQSVVNKAKAIGLTHLYLRLGSSKGGFYDQAELDKLLPPAHAAGLKVIGWDFVYLTDPAADAARAKQEIDYTTPDGHRIDGFSADIETSSEGVNLTAAGAEAYGAQLRALVGPSYPLIATVPRPSPKRPFPFAEATKYFDAIAPMVYWLNRDPANDVAQALADLAPLGKPILPIGQAYDGGPEGGPKGPPPKDALVRFMNVALDKGAVGVSFWVWNQATPEHWAAIDEAHAWELPAGDPSSPAAVRYLQRVISTFGRPVAQDGVLGAQTRSALAAVQQSLGLPGTGKLDRPTISSLVGP